MTQEALSFIDSVLYEAGISYEFIEWTSEELPQVYWVGEFLDVENINEDGMKESTFILTGTTLGSWLDLVDDKDIIENLFPAVGGKVALLENNSSIAIFFDTAQPIQSDSMDVKRLQINLTIKNWKG